MVFLFNDEEIVKTQAGKAGAFMMRHMDRIHLISPFETVTKLDWTAPPGQLSGMWYSLMFWLGKQEWETCKADEYLDVSPVHAQYYQITKLQKEAIEGKIKEGLASAAKAVSDFELLLHDQRKYQEFLDYLGLKYENGKFVETGAPDEHSLKTIFVDQVDFYAGGAAEGAGRLSMSFMQQKNIMPTIVQDFYELGSEADLTKKEQFKNLPKVEKNMLKTKMRAYNEWRNVLFGSEVKNRFRRIQELVTSRENSVKQYREWLKPYIVKHKLLEEGLNRESKRKNSISDWYHSVGQATSQDSIKIWAWKATTPYEVMKYPGEEIAMHPVDLCDSFVKKNLIFHPEHGLITEYPWITEEWVDMKCKELSTGEEPKVKANKLYYAFLILESNRTNLKLANGSELEDIVFKVRGIHMSNNAIMCKLLEKAAKEEEMEIYTNNLLGIESKIPGKVMDVKLAKQNFVKKLKDKLDAVGHNFQFYKGRGPYEKDFNDRIVKFYLSRMAKARYAPVVDYLKTAIGYGT